MRYYLKKIEMHWRGWRNQPSRKEVNRLYNHYRNMVMGNKETIENHLAKNDFNGLAHIAEYRSTIGRWTAIQAAFCLGFKAGKGGANNG